MINEKDIKYELQPVQAHGEKPAVLRSRKPVIDLKKCNKTYRCIVYCPENAIEARKDGYPSVNYDKCDGCLICLRECPTSAIAEVAE